MTEDTFLNIVFRGIIVFFVVASVVIMIGLVTGKITPVKTGIHQVQYNGHLYIKDTQHAYDGYTSSIIHSPDCPCRR
jgi:hypothetical protein